MGTVCSSSLLWSLVDLDVLDDKCLLVKTLGVCIAFGVLQQAEQKGGTLFGPSALSDTPYLCLGASSNSSVEAAERNTLLLFLDIFQKSLCLLQGHSLYDSCGLVCVLKVHTEVCASGFANYEIMYTGILYLLMDRRF